MFNEEQHLWVYNPYSGLVYYVNQTEFKHLEEGVIPLSKKPGNCKKCYGKYHIGRDIVSLVYPPCKCLQKYIKWEVIKANQPDESKQPN